MDLCTSCSPHGGKLDSDASSAPGRDSSAASSQNRPLNANRLRSPFLAPERRFSPRGVATTTCAPPLRIKEKHFLREGQIRAGRSRHVFLKSLGVSNAAVDVYILVNQRAWRLTFLQRLMRFAPAC